MMKQQQMLLLMVCLLLSSCCPTVMAQEDEYGLLRSIRFSPGVNLIFTAYGKFDSILRDLACRVEFILVVYAAAFRNII